MTYLFLIIFTITLIFGSSLFIKTPRIQGAIFSFFVHQVIALSLLVTVFSAITTMGKTIYLLFIPVFAYLFAKKHIQIEKPSFEKLKRNIRYLVPLLAILLIQFALHTDISTLQPYMPSDDVHLYASNAYSFLEYHQENYNGGLSKLYPELFTGMNPYHYYEIWFTAFLISLSGLSGVYIMLFIIFPYLVWLFFIGILAVLEHYTTEIKIKHYFIAFLFLFIGPLYFGIYETLFHDGEFFQTTVFTIVGFVKQTLSFSYFGQKHLTVYIFSLFAFLSFIKQDYKLGTFIALLLPIISFGTFAGIFGGFGLLFIFLKKLRLKSNFILLLSILAGFVVITSLFKIGASSEISEHSFYINDFLKYLNIKGEIMRVFAKIFGPLLWLSILYFPYIIIFGIYRKKLMENPEIKLFFLFIFFSFFAGTIFTTLLQGMSSDQFLTNLLPIYNVIAIIVLIPLYQTIVNKTLIVATGSFIVAVNFLFILNFNSLVQKKTNEEYSASVIASVSKELKKEKTSTFIAYILADTLVQKLPSPNWYPYRPGKPFILQNYFNIVSIDYPYIAYERNSSSILFAYHNQIRFFLKDVVYPDSTFGVQQAAFLKAKSFKWLFCGKGAVIKPEVQSLVEKSYYDKVSGETYCKLKNRH